MKGAIKLPRSGPNAHERPGKRDRAVRQCRPALRHRSRNSLNISFTLFPGDSIFSPGRAERARPRCSSCLSRAAPVARGDPHVRYRRDYPAARAAARPSQANGGGIPGFPAGRSLERFRQYCAAAARVGRARSRSAGAGDRHARVGRAGPPRRGAPGDAVQAAQQQRLLPAPSSVAPTCWWPTNRPAMSIRKWQKLIRLFEALNRLGTTWWSQRTTSTSSARSRICSSCGSTGARSPT